MNLEIVLFFGSGGCCTHLGLAFKRSGLLGAGVCGRDVAKEQCGYLCLKMLRELHSRVGVTLESLSQESL